jgi:hypothetical protein
LAEALLHGAMGRSVLAWLHGPLRRRTETNVKPGQLKKMEIRTNVKEDIASQRKGSVEAWRRGPTS